MSLTPQPPHTTDEHVPVETGQSIAPPTDPRLALPATREVTADAWLGDTFEPAGPETATAWVESQTDGGLPMTDGAPIERRQWEPVADRPETATATTAIETDPTPWPNESFAEPVTTLADQAETFGDAAPFGDAGGFGDLGDAAPFGDGDGFDAGQPSGDLAFASATDLVPDAEETFDFSALSIDGDGTAVDLDDALSLEPSAEATAEEPKTGLKAKLGSKLKRPGRRKQQADTPLAPAAEIDDPLFAEALASPGIDAFDSDPGALVADDSAEVTEVTLSEYVDQHMGHDTPPPPAAPTDDLPFAADDPFQSNALDGDVFADATPEDFFSPAEPAAEKAPTDSVMALMADESEVEVGRSPKHKALLVGAGVAGVALLGLGTIGMLNRDGIDAPSFGGDSSEAPVTLALDEPPVVPLTDMLAAGVVGVTATECGTATGGQGVLVSATTVVTAESVTGQSPTLDITLADGDTRIGTLIGIDRGTGLAVVNLDRPAGDALEWGATNSITIGDALAVSNVEGRDGAVEATLGSKLTIQAQTAELGLAAELPVQPGGAVVNDANQVVAIALADGGVTTLVTSDVLRPTVSEFRLDPERFSGC